MTEQEPVFAIRTLGDNYIYLYRYQQNNAFAVDPGESKTVLDTLKERGWNLTDVLATHHHFDHTAGIQELKNKTNCNVVVGNKPGTLYITDTKIQVIATPGHTRDSVCYYVQPSKNHNGVLFTGDTLFIGGCGRPMECDASTMWDSLRKLAALPDDTLVYPGHDYTEENYEFALTIETNNPALKLRLEQIKQAQREALPTVPSTMKQEKGTNVFLRADDPEIKSAIGLTTAAAAEVFAELRLRKNAFG